MPVYRASGYRSPFFLRNGHAQTIFPVLFRPRPEVIQRRERLRLPDDFIDLDLTPAAPPAPRRGVAIISHGLEGHSRRRYVQGMARALAADGWDVVARNLRGCGGEINWQPRMYHSGETGDLHATVQYCLARGYRRIALVGFSIGGNQTLKYLGENPGRVPVAVVGAVAFSVPCDMVGAAAVMERPANRVYVEYFMRSLREKIREKVALFPDLFDLTGLDAIHTFAEFDTRFTAPMHGFTSAMDYWQRSGCLTVLPAVRVPTLLVNARNDPFLSPGCFPEAEAERNPALLLETPSDGGHVGFATLNDDNRYWSEARAVEFLAGLGAERDGHVPAAF